MTQSANPPSVSPAADTADTPDTPDNPVSGSVPTTQAHSVQVVLEKLFELYPQLFGARFVPLKLGVFQELVARHPDAFQRDSLKAALGFHTRSTRYLQCVASGEKRHDLEGEPVDPVAPEHVHLALLELFRRRQSRSREDLRPRFRAQLIAAFEASGLSRQDYLARVQNRDEEATRLLEEALDEHAEKVAKEAALLRAFQASGKTPTEFADMYGIKPSDIETALARSRQAGAPLTPA